MAAANEKALNLEESMKRKPGNEARYAQELTDLRAKVYRMEPKVDKFSSQGSQGLPGILSFEDPLGSLVGSVFWAIVLEIHTVNLLTFACH